jgi:phosphatidylserine/phosphatidylglycerophosphate/cardiolipin synthase-like enzyme
MAKTKVRAYGSPTCVLLAFDWTDGSKHPDFLGFAIRRDPGYGKDGKPQFLFNKLDFIPLTSKSKPKGSDKAPIQKFNWWDGGLKTADRGRTFTYTVTPVLGTGAQNLKLQKAAAGTVKVTIPPIIDHGIATYFNRAVVSSQSFTSLKNTGATLETQMDWLANGLEASVPDVLTAADSFDCAIYHLSDRRWVLPALKQFPKHGSIVYFDESNANPKRADHVSREGLKFMGAKPKIATHVRTRVSKLMHDKFIVAFKGGKAQAVLLGSTNFTPEAFTVQANLLHVFASPQLASAYGTRHDLLAGDPDMKETTKHSSWSKITDIPDSQVRVIFCPEPGKQRTFLDTVTAAVKGAKSSVLFCMFTATDQALLTAILAAGDSGRLIYGMINSIPDPTTKPPKPGAAPTAAQQVAVTIFNRSRHERDVLAYNYFDPASAPAGFLPEFRTINVTKYSGGKGPPIAVHIHHKFIVIDGDTPHPTIYTGSANFSTSSENKNDENVLEIKGNTRLTQVYVAEFMRLYNHYRARALWAIQHPHPKGKVTAKKLAGPAHDPLVLKTTRDAWVNDAYKKGTATYRARTRLL